MAKENIQKKDSTPQSGRTSRIIINESNRIKGSGDAGGFERSKSGNASDSTSSTGPRKK